MKSGSIRGDDSAAPRLIATISRPLLLAAALLFLQVLGPSSIQGAVSIAEIARLEGAVRLDRGGVLSLFRGYVSLGLPAEAAALLERKLNSGEFPRGEATALFEEIASERGEAEDPAVAVAICETAFRNGVQTPLIHYAYGTALRLSGRATEGRAALSRIGPGSAVFPYALFAIGQIAAETGDVDAATAIFRRVRESSGDRAEDALLKTRATRSLAGLLLSRGRKAEATAYFASLLRDGDDPLARIGLFASNKDDAYRVAVFPMEISAGWPCRQRIEFSLLRGGLSMDRADPSSAVAHFLRAEEELDGCLGATDVPASEAPERWASAGTLSRQVAIRQSLREKIISGFLGSDSDTVRSDLLELLAGFLLLEHSVAKSEASLPSLPDAGSGRADEVEGILRRIEVLSLDGRSVDRLVEELMRRLDTLQNLPHPIARFRLLSRLEKLHAEIREIKERIVQRRRAAAGMHGRSPADSAGLLRELGRYLVAVDEVREAASEARAFSRRHFNILRVRPAEEEGAIEARRKEWDEVLAFEDSRFAALLPSIRTREEAGWRQSWERRKQELSRMRPIILRRVVDGLVAEAGALRERRSAGPPEEWRDLLERAASYLPGDRLGPSDKAECAVNIGALLAGPSGPWEPFPGGRAGEQEARLISLILPFLATDAHDGARREEALYVSALLRSRRGDRDAGRAAREFLVGFPASPLTGELAARLGHGALLAGRPAEAADLYRSAAESSRPETRTIGRYMLGWLRFQSGDAHGAIRELAEPLFASSFRCTDPSAPEEEVLSLAVRAFQESSLERIRSYAPIRDGTCGGKLLLTRLAEAEERRGETFRAALVYSAISQSFPDDEGSFAHEKRAVENLFRGGKGDEAFSRFLELWEKYGPDSAWAKSRPDSERKSAIADLARLVRTLSEWNFEEGIRSGKRSSMAAAAAGWNRYFLLEDGERSGADDDELRLKWAVAALRSGDREGGLGLLLETMGERRSDPIAERASLLYAETAIAGYERGEGTADEAEESLMILCGNYPSEKSAALTLRAALAFSGAEEFERAARAAGEVESNQLAPKALVTAARLVRAEALLRRDDFASARAVAVGVLEETASDADGRHRERAKDLFLLSSLKAAEAGAAAGNWTDAARLLEETAAKFPEAADAPAHLLRALRSYRHGKDDEGVLRTGLLFLRKYPDRTEAVEAAGIVGPQLEERKEYLRAADLYASTADRHPKTDSSPDFLFRAARLSADHGDPATARKRFADYRSRYANPRWRTAYAVLSAGLLGWEAGAGETSLRDLEEGIRRADAGVEQDAPEEFRQLVGKARIAVALHWAERFRNWKSAAPWEKSFAVKDRFFRKALASFETAAGETPLETAVEASRRLGDLLVDFAKEILDSRRPAGMKGEERERYEVSLAARARNVLEKAVDWYVAALDRLETEDGPADLAFPVVEGLEGAQALLARTKPPAGEAQ